MILSHYSAKPLVFNPTRVYHQEDHFKPRGFWLSVDGNGDGWKEWCEGENFNVGSLVYRTDFELTSGANVLVVDTAEDVRALTREYSVPGMRVGSSHAIDWPRIKRLYDGIVIAPYQWECRHDNDTFWYYSWDCASGCVWNLRAISLVGVSA